MPSTSLNIDEYIAQCAESSQQKLQALRQFIQQLAPEATETINYQMPTFRLNGNLIHFACYAKHISLYPGAEAIAHFEEELKDYKTSKGTIHISLDSELPKSLIEKIILFNVERLKDKIAPDWKKHNNQWDEANELMTQIMEELPLKREFKWGGEVYTYKGKNIVSFSGFKHHFALWFFNGIFLEDKEKLLVTATDKTKAQRQWRFFSSSEINPPLVKAYVQEAIQTVIDGKFLQPTPLPTPKIEGLLLDELSKDRLLQQSFEGLTLSKQREYISYIAEAKQQKTKESRLEKCIPLIRGGQGLYDKYKK
ncbi:DUF1801 domain-containing protein [Sphingobacterium sp. MYb382]|uniref:DUF1801 domain-containing protein n=1 Tax=Sphingobacterium sp. MYb382 TaxID=2745278 RepID=UPI0030ADBBFF